MTIDELEIGQLDLSGMQSLAVNLLRELPTPLAIGLVGTLGAGKTQWVQFVVQASAGAQTEVTSPTFTLVQTYEGAPRVHHLDAYRLADEDEFIELGVDELFADETAWTIVEWADRVGSVMPRQTLWIELALLPDVELRRVTLRCSQPEVMEIIRLLKL